MPKKRVLIADDSAIMRKVIGAYMEQEPDIQVCALTATGAEAVSRAIELRPDLLILDLQMPVMNGVEVAGVLQKNLPSAKTVIFTLYENSLSTRLASAAGVSAVLSKTDGLTALGKTVRALLAQKFREAEESLARAARGRKVAPSEMESLTQQLDAPLTRCSRELKYLWANEQYAAWLQRPVETIVGQSILDVLGQRAFGVLKRHFEQVLHGAGVVYDEVAEFDKIGKRRVSAAYKPTLSNDGTVDGWVAYVEDKTDTSTAQTAESLQSAS